MPEILESLPPKQQLAVLALANGASHAGAAKVSGLSPDTVSFYSGQARFKSALAEVLRTTAEAHLARIAAAGGEAVTVLLDLMHNSKADAIKLRAAMAVIHLLQRDAGGGIPPMEGPTMHPTETSALLASLRS